MSALTQKQKEMIISRDTEIIARYKSMKSGDDKKWAACDRRLRQLNKLLELNIEKK